eukprot:10149410-Lingulodinium_polyedra.AAC.1
MQTSIRQAAARAGESKLPYTTLNSLVPCKTNPTEHAWPPRTRWHAQRRRNGRRGSGARARAKRPATK